MLAIIEMHEKGADFCGESSCMQRQGEGDHNSAEEAAQRPCAKNSCSKPSTEARWALELAAKVPCLVNSASLSLPQQGLQSYHICYATGACHKAIDLRLLKP